MFLFDGRVDQIHWDTFLMYNIYICVCVDTKKTLHISWSYISHISNLETHQTTGKLSHDKYPLSAYPIPLFWLVVYQVPPWLLDPPTSQLIFLKSMNKLNSPKGQVVWPIHNAIETRQKRKVKSNVKLCYHSYCFFKKPKLQITFEKHWPPSGKISQPRPTTSPVHAIIPVSSGTEKPLRVQGQAENSLTTHSCFRSHCHC